MKYQRLLVPILIVAVVSVAAAQENPAAKDLKKLQGDWIMVSGERDGTKLSDEHVAKNKMTWKGKDVVLVSPHQSKEAIRSTIGDMDPSKKPAEMDWTRSAGPDAGKKMLAIYEFIDGDQYRICFAPAGKDRPKEFTTKAGSGHMLHVWKRVK